MVACRWPWKGGRFDASGCGGCSFRPTGFVKQLNVLCNMHLRPQIIRCSRRCRWLKLCILGQVQLNDGLHIGWLERLF